MQNLLFNLSEANFASLEVNNNYAGHISYATALSVPLYCRHGNSLKRKLLTNQLKKLKGFTLAEVLITLTIIGVVAAISIPTLISKYTKHTYVVGLKKAYSQLSNAVKMVPVSEGCPDGDLSCAGWNDYNTYEGKTFSFLNGKRSYMISKQFKVDKLCGGTDNGITSTGILYKCLGYDSQHDISDLDLSGVANAFVTADGTIFFSSVGGIIPGDNTGSDVYQVYVDVNGPKGPNEIGRDLFSFFVGNSNPYNVPEGTVIPTGSALEVKYWGSSTNTAPWTPWKTSCVSENTQARNWTSCTARVLEEDAMNY